MGIAALTAIEAAMGIVAAQGTGVVLADLVDTLSPEAEHGLAAVDLPAMLVVLAAATAADDASVSPKAPLESEVFVNAYVERWFAESHLAQFRRIPTNWTRPSALSTHGRFCHGGSCRTCRVWPHSKSATQ
jgi:hypothetical protein